MLARLIEDTGSSEVRDFASVPSATLDKTRKIIEAENHISQLRHDEFTKRWAEEARLRDEEKKRLKEERAARHGERIEAYRSPKREERIVELSHIADAAKRLEIIAKDCEFAPYYYPGEFADVDNSTLSQLEPELLANLAEKLILAPKGKWRSLRTIIIEKIGSMGSCSIDS